MALTLFKPQERDTHPTIGSEISLTQMSFNIHKFNNRPKPKERDRILIISCFCEFGCEIVGRLCVLVDGEDVINEIEANDFGIIRARVWLKKLRDGIVEQFHESGNCAAGGVKFEV